jgi:hypothetical protein
MYLKHRQKEADTRMFKCRNFHRLDEGQWMGLKARLACSICSISTTKIAFNCSKCVIDVCETCANKYRRLLAFAHHLAFNGRLALLKDQRCMYDRADVLYEEYHAFNNTEIYRKTIVDSIKKTEQELKEAESLVVGLKRKLATRIHDLAESDAMK